MAEGAGELGRRRVYPNSMGLWPHPITPVTPARPLKHPRNCPLYLLHLSPLDVTDRVRQTQISFPFNYKLNLLEQENTRTHTFYFYIRVCSCNGNIKLADSRFAIFQRNFDIPTALGRKTARIII